MTETEDQVTERDEQGGDPELGTCHICGQEFGTQEELFTQRLLPLTA